MTRSQSTIDKEELLNVARNCACSAARKLSRSLTREYDRAMKSSGLKSTQFIILVAVSLGEKAQIGTLAQRLGLERTTLTRNLALLERDGLIKTAKGSDGRARIISVSARGRAAVRSALPLWRKAQESMSDVLDVPSLIKQSNAPCGGMAER